MIHRLIAPRCLAWPLLSLVATGVACGSSPPTGNTTSSSSGGGGGAATTSSSSSSASSSSSSTSSSSSSTSSSSSSTSSSSSSSSGGGTGGTGGTGTGGMGTGGMGGVMCTGAQVDCGGTCVDLGSDGAHCGACGHSCLGGTCSGGMCAATDVIAASTAQLVKLDSATIFYTTYYDIFALPKAGGTPTDLNHPMNTLEFGAYDFAIDAGRVFWTAGFSPTTGFVLDVSKSGFGQTELYDQLGGYGKPFGIVTGDIDANGQAGAVYWCEHGDGMWFPSNIVKTTLGPSGASSKIIATVPVKFLYGIARDNTYAYVTTQDTAEIYRAPLAGGSSASFASGFTSPTSLVSDGQELYVLDLGTYANGGYPDGKVYSVPLAGGAPTVLASAIPNLGGITVDSGTVYFTSSWSASVMTSDGTVLAVPAAGGPVVTIATGQPHPLGIAVDTTHVYWADYGVSGQGGGIRRAPR